MIKKFIFSVLSLKILTPIKRLLKQIHNFKLLAKDYGQWRTIRNWNSVDESDKPTPWYTYPTTEFLSHLNLSQLKVFEYGSGNSTLWWSKRAKQVTSVENDEVWHKKIKDSLKTENVICFLEKDRQKYISKASNDFDIFVVDGSYRQECLEQVVNLKKIKGGSCSGAVGLMLILDNSDRYPQSVWFVQQKLGWIQMDFHGFGPINSYTWTTSIFINPVRYSELSYCSLLKSKCALAQENHEDN
jgi:hypothetical protein